MPFIGAAINAASQGFQNRKQRKHEKSMYQQEYKDTIAFWNMQNEYNTPANQMSRLEDAGINKLMPFVGGSSPQNTASSPDVPKQSISTLPAPNVGNSLDNLYDLKLKKAGINKIDEETKGLKVNRQRAIIQYLNEAKYSAQNAGNESDVKYYDRRIKEYEYQVQLDREENLSNTPYQSEGRYQAERLINQVKTEKDARQLIIQQTQNQQLQNKRLKELEKLMKTMPEGSEALQSVLYIILGK